MEMFRSDSLEKEYLDTYNNYMYQIPIKFDERFIKSKWCNTHIIHCGNPDGKPLVLLHCMGITSLCWLKNIEALAVKYDIYLIDIIGEPNRTTNYTNQVSFDEYILWLDDTLHKLELKNIQLAGWSFGGFLAVGYAIHHPEMVNKLMAFSPAGTISKLTTKFMIKLMPALISGKETRIHAFWTWICRDTTKTAEYKIFCKGMQSFQGWARGTSVKVYNDKKLASLKMPCLILLGDNDPIYTGRVKRDVERINKLNNLLHIEFIDGTHGFIIQNADMANQRIFEFFG